MNSSKDVFTLAVVLSACLTSMLVAQAQSIIYVPTDYATIQAAIDNAGSGDEVIVAPGTYPEKINFLGRAVYLHSSGGAEVTTIDASGLNDSGVTCENSEGPGTVLEGFTIANGFRIGFGSGMRIIDASPVVQDCIFTANGGEFNTGGGISIQGGNPLVTRCQFINNDSEYGGGIWVQGTGIISHCWFVDNYAGRGAGIHAASGDTHITNCLFLNNETGGKGGAINAVDNTVTNCLFVANMTWTWGGALSIDGTSVTNSTFFANSAAYGAGAVIGAGQLSNSILWGNSPDQIDGDVTVSYSNVDGGYAGTGNINADPLFLDADGVDDVLGTLDDDLRLDAGSPCIDAADNDAVPADTPDLDDDGDTSEPLPYDLDNYDRFVDDPGTVDSGQGTPPIVDMGSYEFQNVSMGPVLYVDANAPDGGNGYSWATAFNDVQAALALAAQFPENVDEIWVANGMYKPAGPGGSRNATFQLISGVGLYGGFDGDESERDERDPDTHITMLSGDLDGNDGPDFTNYDDNSYNVVKGSHTDATAIIDGFIIRSGNDPRVVPYGGGGMHITDGAPTVVDCMFAGNTSYVAGAMGIYTSDPTVTGCTFVYNFSESGGAAYIYNHSNPVFRHCRFTANEGINRGGAITNIWDNNSLFDNCVFTDNKSIAGGAIFGASNDSVIMRNCTLAGNDGGRAIYNAGTAFTLVSSIIWDNIGGAIYGDRVMASYNNVEGGYQGTGNIDADPLFVDLDGGDVHLLEESPCVNAGDPDDQPSGETDMDGDERLQHCRLDMGSDETPYYFDCNSNGEPDACDVRDGTSADCNDNGKPDECDLVDGTSEDCNSNSIPDECDIADGTTEDCNANGVPDLCDIDDGTSEDANGNGRPDECEAVHNVTQDTWHQHIQLAIDDAVNGDDVVVSPGVFEENINLLGKAINLHSSDGPDVTIIDAGGAGGDVVTCTTGEGADTIIEGFTITGGRTGLAVSDGSPTIHDCTITANDSGASFETSGSKVTSCRFTNNTGGYDGGGMNIYACTLTVSDCLFQGNYSSGAGGGLGILEDNSTISKCTFLNNTAEYFGGGMYLDSQSDPTITNCWFESNFASERGGGISMWNGSSPTIANSVLVGNESVREGGAIQTFWICNPKIINCTIINNRAWRGGGMDNYDACYPVVSNSIIWGNTPNQIVDYFYSETTLSYSDIEGGWSGPGSNNIDIAPRFVAPGAGDFRLHSGAACIDAADNDAVPPDTADLDGDGNTSEPSPYDLNGLERFVDDPATEDTGHGEAPVVDMGAYEFEGLLSGDIDGDGTIGMGDLLMILSRWGQCEPDSDCPGDLDRDDVVGMSDLLIVLTEWGPI